MANGERVEPRDSNTRDLPTRLALEAQVVDLKVENERLREHASWLATWVIQLSPGAEDCIDAALACAERGCEEPLPLEEFLAAGPVKHLPGCPYHEEVLSSDYDQERGA